VKAAMKSVFTAPALERIEHRFDALVYEGDGTDLNTDHRVPARRLGE
jgi:hypothetical protein